MGTSLKLILVPHPFTIISINLSPQLALKINTFLKTKRSSNVIFVISYSLGKGPSIWDHWTHTRQFFILDGKNADISSDSYHHLENDVKLLKDLGVNHYRFSLSWPRIFSSGLPNSINQEAITYYSNLLQALNETNIAAMVTIFHWDMPKTMHDLGGWTNKVVVNYYVQYAKAVIQQFGDKVAFWLTFHDPYATCVETNGIKGFDEYRCMHNVLKAHAQVYRYYKENTNFKGKTYVKV